MGSKNSKPEPTPEPTHKFYSNYVITNVLTKSLTALSVAEKYCPELETLHEKNQDENSPEDRFNPLFNYCVEADFEECNRVLHLVADLQKKYAESLPSSKRDAALKQTEEIRKLLLNPSFTP